MKLKQKIFRGLFVGEIVLFTVWYFLGSQGVVATKGVQQERVAIETHVEQLRAEISQLKHEIMAHRADELYKERIAREQLQMAREGDTVYFLN